LLSALLSKEEVGYGGVGFRLLAFALRAKTPKTSLPEGGLLFREPLGRGEQKTTIVECLIQ